MLSTRQRQANSKLAHFDHALTVDKLINPTSRTWNSVQVINHLVESENAMLIESMSLSRFQITYKDGRHFTQSGKYTVKSGYKVKHLYPNRARSPTVSGLDTKALWAHLWTIKHPPKLKYFIWKIVSGSLSMRKNIRSRRITCGVLCERCGAKEETINYILFECPSAIHVWA